MTKLQPVVLSGGSGTRLWPLSREHYPKQLLALVGNLTLLQETCARLEGLDALETGPQVAPFLIVCNEEHRFLVAEQLRQVGCAVRRILLEPEGRNTAPALTLAALCAEAGGEDPVLLVMPADHVVKNVAVFQNVVLQGYKLAERGALVTFGIVPTEPETGYGYIRTGAARAGGGNDIAQFVEKPDAATAVAYVASGHYLWNSGMFMMRASVWLEAIGRYRGEIHVACRLAYTAANQDQDFVRVAANDFKNCPSDSIDYAVMERVAQPGSGFDAVVLPLSAGWSDVGAWPALLAVNEADARGNVTKGDVYTHGVSNSLLYSEHRIVAAVGVDDMVVVETADAVLVAHRDHAQDVKKIVEQLKAEGRSESIMHRRCYRPWGWYEGIDAGVRFQVKRIMVKPRASLSLQMHHHRAEHWIVVKGTARVTRGDETFLLSENESTYIPLGIRHRLDNPGTIPLEIIEVQSGSYLGEDDIVRFEDVYGR